VNRAVLLEPQFRFVLLDQLIGEYSLLGQMKAGSVRVKPGDRVLQDQILGRIWLLWRLDFSPFA
jgi:hypothetical protein